MPSIIEINGLEKSFGEKKVLCGVDLNIDRGESLVIIGSSGCGKSVLLKHINRLMTPDAGSVTVFDSDLANVTSRSLREIREKVGMLFQSAALLDSLTVGENVGLALKENSSLRDNRIADIVAQKLEMVGMSGTEELYPSDLSGGMRKRIGLARAISTDPEIVLYDEPTTGLDPITADLINDLIVTLHKKLSITSISVTHDMRAAYKTADRIVMLYNGKIEYEGTPEEIKRSGNPVVDQFINGRAEGPIQVN